MANLIQLQCLLGIRCRDFTMIAADQTNTTSIVVMKRDENKLFNITDSLVLGVIGDRADTLQFTQFVSKNIELYKMKNNYSLDTAASVHFTRKNLSDSLRDGTPKMINMLVAGYDERQGGLLYVMDFLASCVKVPFAVHGFGGMLCFGLIDSKYRDNLTENEAYELIKMCVYEIHERLFINLPNFQVKSVSKHGIKELPVIKSGCFSENESVSIGVERS